MIEVWFVMMFWCFSFFPLSLFWPFTSSQLHRRALVPTPTPHYKLPPNKNNLCAEQTGETQTLWKWGGGRRRAQRQKEGFVLMVNKICLTPPPLTLQPPPPSRQTSSLKSGNDKSGVARRDFSAPSLSSFFHTASARRPAEATWRRRRFFCHGGW